MPLSLRTTHASLPRTARSQPVVLGGDPKGKTFLYCNGNSVFIRDIENPSICDVYSQHQKDTTVAKYAPSGYYIASGDVSGKLRIWDTTQKEHILKYEYQPISGAITDIVWSPDSKRIAISGDGRQTFAAAFLWDTGSSVGSLHCHSKKANSVDYKPTRPYRVVTASEDRTSAFFEGPPFKFKQTQQDHSSFVNVIKYSPDGSVFVSGGTDKRAFIYDGNDGSLKAELGGGATPAHDGGILSLVWNPENSQLLTVSGDKTAKLWDVEQNQLVTEFTFGTAVNDQQVGCLWQGQYLLTVSLSGEINYLDLSNPSKPIRVLKGHNKNITAMTPSVDKASVFSASFDHEVRSWDLATADCHAITGNRHTNQINKLVAQSDKVYSAAMDDTVKSFNAADAEYSSESFGTNGIPKGLACSEDLTAVATVNEVTLLRNGKKIFSQKESYEPLSVSIHPGQTELAVGGADGKIHIYNINGDTLLKNNQLNAHGAVNDVSYSPDGLYLASGDSGKAVGCWVVAEAYTPLKAHWSYHTARVNSIAWSPNSRYVASASLDTHIYVWSVEKPTTRQTIKGAHGLSTINCIAWIDDNTIITAASDCCLKSWDVIHS